MIAKPYHAELNRLRRLLDTLANGDAEVEIRNRFDINYPTIGNKSVGLVQCEEN